AAAHGREEPVGLRRHEQENRRRGRLLEALEQGVLRVRVHGLGRIDQDDSQTGPVSADREEVRQLAYLLDADLVAALFPRLGALLRVRRQALRDDEAEIGMIPQREPAATLAFPAGLCPRFRLLAQQGLGDGPGELELAPAVAALEQDRMGKP